MCKVSLIWTAVRTHVRWLTVLLGACLPFLLLGRWSLSWVSPQARSHPRDPCFLGLECSSSEQFEGQARWGPQQVWLSGQNCRCSMFWSVNKHDPTDILLTLILCEDEHTAPPQCCLETPHSTHQSASNTSRTPNKSGRNHHLVSKLQVCDWTRVQLKRNLTLFY